MNLFLLYVLNRNGAGSSKGFAYFLLGVTVLVVVAIGFAQ